MLQAGQQIGPFVVVRHLATGGTSEVYLVQEGARPLALKILKDSLCHLTAPQARMINEATVLESLHIDGVVRVLYNDDFEGRPYYVMEYLPSSLAERLSSPQRLVDVLPWLMAIARILAALHARGFVHRDVKPQNILFAQDHTPRLADFGHAKLPDEAGSIIPHSTETGTFLGTRDYAAPEQILNAKAVTDRADIYSLGVILFEALAGRRPFVARTEEARTLEQLTRRAPRLSRIAKHVPPALDELVARMLATDPQKRPTADEVVTRLSTLPQTYVSPMRWPRYAAALFLPLFLSCPLHSYSFADFDQALDLHSLDAAAAILDDTAGVALTPYEEAKRTQKQADLLRERGDLKPAQDAYAEACEQFKGLQKTKDQANCLTRLAEMHLHAGDAEPARHLYEEARALRERRAARDETSGGDEFYYAAYALGLWSLEQGDAAQAAAFLFRARGLTQNPLYLARTEERLAALTESARHSATPTADTAIRLADSAWPRAEAALRSKPRSRLAQLIHVRVALRRAWLREDSALEQAAWDKLDAVWSADRRRGLWAHSYLELLFDRLAQVPQREDLRARARLVFRELGQRSQWQGDVHVQRWQSMLEETKPPARPKITAAAPSQPNPA